MTMIQVTTLDVGLSSNVINGELLGADQFTFAVKPKGSELIYCIYKHGYYKIKGIGREPHTAEMFGQMTFLKKLFQTKEPITIHTIYGVVTGTLKFHDRYNINIDGVLYNKAQIRMFVFDGTIL